MTFEDKAEALPENAVRDTPWQVPDEAPALRRQVEALRGELATAQARREKSELALGRSLARLEALEGARNPLESRVAELEAENAGLQLRVQTLETEKEKLGKTLKAARLETESARATLARLRSSLSWRITAPLRQLGGGTKKR